MAMNGWKKTQKTENSVAETYETINECKNSEMALKAWVFNNEKLEIILNIKL